MFPPLNYLKTRLSSAGCFLLAAIAIWIGVCSGLTIHAGDDLDYIFFIHDQIWNSYGEINTPADLFSSLWFHYLGVNGRYVAHLLVQIFCSARAQTAFAICNALVYPVFILLIVKTAGGKSNSYATLLTTAILVLCGFITKMMPTCQIGYVWMFILALIWWCLLEKSIAGDKKINSPKLTIPLLLLGMIAGNGSEALNIGLFGAIVLEYILNKGKIRRNEAALMIGFAIGLLFLCLSPAMHSRSQNIKIPAADSVIMFLLSLRILYVAIIAVFISRYRHHNSWRSIYLYNRVWINASLILIAMNFYIGVYCNRQLFGIELCCAIITLRSLRDCAFSKGWLVAGSLITIVTCCFLLSWLLNSRSQFLKIESIFISQPYSTVYIDRYRSSSSMQGMIGRYDEHAIGAGNADVEHSVSKYMKFKYPGHKRLWLMPYALQGHRDDDEPLPYGSVTEYHPGHFLVVTDTMRKWDIHAREELNLPGLHISQRERILSTREMKNTAPKGEAYNAWLIVPASPWLRITDVKAVAE